MSEFAFTFPGRDTLAPNIRYALTVLRQRIDPTIRASVMSYANPKLAFDYLRTRYNTEDAQAPSSSVTPFRFFDLPFEIRTLIYEKAMAPRDIHARFYSSKDPLSNQYTYAIDPQSSSIYCASEDMGALFYACPKSQKEMTDLRNGRPTRLIANVADLYPGHFSEQVNLDCLPIEVKREDMNIYFLTISPPGDGGMPQPAVRGSGPITCPSVPVTGTSFPVNVRKVCIGFDLRNGRWGSNTTRRIYDTVEHPIRLYAEDIKKCEAKLRVASRLPDSFPTETILLCRVKQPKGSAALHLRNGVISTRTFETRELLKLDRDSLPASGVLGLFGNFD